MGHVRRITSSIKCAAVLIGFAGGLQTASTNAFEDVCNLRDIDEAEGESRRRAEWFDYWDGGEVYAAMAIRDLELYILHLNYKLRLMNNASCRFWKIRSEDLYNTQARLKRAYSVLRKIDHPHH